MLFYVFTEIRKKVIPWVCNSMTLGQNFLFFFFLWGELYFHNQNLIKFKHQLKISLLNFHTIF